MADSEGRVPIRAVGAGKNTMLAFATQMATAAFTAVLTLYLVRALGPAEFGLFSLAVSIGGLLILPADLGISASASRFIAERFGDWKAVSALLADALRIKLTISILVSVAAIVLAGPIASAYGEPNLDWPIRWTAIAVIGQSLVSFYRYAFMAMRDGSVGLRLVFGESAVETTASILIVVAVGGAAGASAGRAVGYGFGAALAIVLTFRRLGRPAFVRSGRMEETRRALKRYAGAIFSINVAFAASVSAAPLLIGAFLSSREVGLFTAPSRLLVLLQYPGVSVANGISPRMARGEGQEPDVRTFTIAVRYMIVVQALIVAPIVVWAEPIVGLLLGAGYEESADLLRKLGPYIFVSGLSGVIVGAVNYLGEAGKRVPVAIGDVVLTVALTIGGLAVFGLSGAAYAADIVSVLYVAFHIWLVRRLVDLPMRPLVLSLARSLLAAAALGGVLFAFGTSDLAVWEWFAGGAGGLAAFVAVIVVTGEVSVGELRQGLARVRGALAARRSAT